MTKNKVLIVGGAGYIGSMVNKLLVERGDQTIILDSLTTGHKESLVGGELVVADYGDRLELQRLLAGHSIDAVLHFGACTSVGESIDNPATYYENNVGKSLTLFEEMISNRCLRLLFSSSAAIYGNPESSPVNEEHPKQPINPYGRSKWMCEEILQDFDHAYDFRSISLRYFNAAGGDPAGDLPDYRTEPVNLIPIILRSILEGKPRATIFGTDYETPDGTCIRDYIHLYDLATAHLLALDRLLDGAPTTAYNLGNGAGFSVREVVDAIAKVTGAPLEIVEEERRAGDPPRLVADATRAKAELAWKPIHPSLEAIVRDSWRAISATLKAA